MFSVVLILQLFAPPATPGAPATAPQAPASDYDLSAASQDVEVILVGRGKDYIDARARLEQYPALAAEAVVARLEAVPAPGPEKRDRLLNVLAVLKRPEHVAMFGGQLRRAMLADRPTELWLQLLQRQGAAAIPVLVELVGDRDLRNEQRATLLEALVDATASEDLAELMTMVGRGASELQDALRRAVIRRAREHSDDRAALAAGIDEDLDTDATDAGRVAQLLILRAACCDIDDPFTARLEALLTDPTAPFQVQVAAIDGLDRLGRGAGVLEAMVRAQGKAALEGSQAAEILVALALEALPPDTASTLGSELSLTTSAAPRLAELGYRYATLAADHSWLAASQQHAWPEVRKAALTRVADNGGCDKATVRALSNIAGPVSGGGELDTRVGRAAVGALGRCNDPNAYKALRELLDNTGVDLTQRAEAARQLVEHDPGGPDHVAALLLDGRYPDLARELVVALGHTPSPSEIVRDALCRTSRANPMVAALAGETASKLFPGVGCETE